MRWAKASEPEGEPMSLTDQTRSYFQAYVTGDRFNFTGGMELA